MPRPKRDKAPGLHHVTVGATGEEQYYVDDVDRLTWIRRLVRVLDRYGWRCVIFCQLTTHVHALFDIPDESLPLGMHRLNSEYGKDFNLRHARRGYLRRSRYWSRRIETGDDLLAVYRYIARNPIRAGLCARPEEWRWSSFPTSCGLVDAFPFADVTPVAAELHCPAREALRALAAD